MLLNYGPMNKEEGHDKRHRLPHKSYYSIIWGRDSRFQPQDRQDWRNLVVCLTYEHVLKANTGHRIADVKSFNRSKDRLNKATESMAENLESVGVSAFDRSRIMHAIGDVTGEVTQINGRFRNLLLLPSVAKSVRSQTVKELTYFIENHRNGQYFRYMVITSGVRVAFGDDLKARRKKTLNNFKRWAYDVRRLFDVEVLYRGDEYTFNEDGAHFHVNVLFYPRRILSKNEFSDFLDFSRQRFGGVWLKDCGILNNPREVIKYICKLTGDGEDDAYVPYSCESWGADELTPSQLLWLHEQTYRQKHSQPVGEFADFLADMRADNKKVVGLRSGADVSLKMMKKPKHQINREKKERTNGIGAENVIINRTLPSPSSSGVFEPKTLVLGYTSAPVTGCGFDGLRLILSNQRQAHEWVKSKDFIVHNTTPTVQTSGSGWSMTKHMNYLLRRKQHEQKREQQQRKRILRQYKHVLRSDIVIAGTHAKQSMKRYRQYKHVSGFDCVVAGGFGFRP